MRSGSPGRATPVAALTRLLRRGAAIVLLLIIIACLVVPVQVLAYRENMMELVVASNPPIIVQNQSYSTSTRQDLFHTATNAATDTEAFAFSGLSPAGIDLAQTSSYTGAGTETGYFRSTASSDIVPPVHIGNGFLGTWIGDPIWTGAPIFAGLTFPSMMQTDVSALASMPQGLSTPGGARSAGAARPAGPTAAKSATDKSITTDASDFRPVIDNALNDTLPDPDARNASAAVSSAKAAANATRNESAQAATPEPSPAPSPGIKPGQVFYHQQNKPFSEALSVPSGPFKYTPQKVQNTTGFYRFLTNTVGRSTTDKAFNGTTSSPTYIKPADALAEQIPYDFIQGARGMTMPGTHLNYRAWPL